ncbi:MAG: CRISPR-associated protein Cas4, partial [Pseudanabaena sp.]
AYCHHRCWRMFCAGEFVENHYTIEGTDLHQRVHTVGENQREETWQIRAIWLKSEQYGLIGKSDLIEEVDGNLYPIEYKRGHKGEWDNDVMQVVAQALCLEEMTGKSVTKGYVYYAQTHQRQEIEITSELRKEAIAAISEISQMMETGKMPPAIYGNRCKGCSLFKQCVPQAMEKVMKYREG